MLDLLPDHTSKYLVKSYLITMYKENTLLDINKNIRFDFPCIKKCLKLNVSKSSAKNNGTNLPEFTKSVI